MYLLSGADNVKAGCNKCGALNLTGGDGIDVAPESLEPLRQSDGVFGDERIGVELEEYRMSSLGGGGGGGGGSSVLRRLTFSPLEFKASMAKSLVQIFGCTEISPTKMRIYEKSDI